MSDDQAKLDAAEEERRRVEHAIMRAAGLTSCPNIAFREYVHLETCDAIAAEVSLLRAELARKTEALEAATGRRFPVLDNARYSVPWYLVAPFEAQARDNHDQSLARLAERGGLSSIELIAAIEGRGCSWVVHCKMTEREARARVCELLGLDAAMQPHRSPPPEGTKP